MPNYYVSQWALLRKNELIDLPEDFEIHSDYLKILSKERIISILKTIRQMFSNICQDIADYPERFKMPMIEIIEAERTKNGSPPAKALSSKTAPYMFFDALMNLLFCGRIENGELIIDDHEKIKHANQMIIPGKKVNHPLKNVDALYSQFGNYGLYLDGLKNYKFSKDTGRIVLSYPDDPDVLVVLKWMADKAFIFTQDQSGRQHSRQRDFTLCEHRLLQDAMDSVNYGLGADYIADRLHTKAEQDCAYQIDAALRKDGFLPYIDTTEDNAEANYSLIYFKNGEDVNKRDKSNVRISSKRMKLHLRIRTKNIQNGVEHIKKCSDELKNVFIPGDTGCSNRPNCEIKSHAFGGGQIYTIDGTKYWKCGCHTGNFVAFQPRSEDIGDYMTLLELFNQQ